MVMILSVYMYIIVLVVTNTQDHLKILHHGPFFSSDPLLGKIAVVWESEVVVHSLLGFIC